MLFKFIVVKVLTVVVINRVARWAVKHAETE